MQPLPNSTKITLMDLRSNQHAVTEFYSKLGRSDLGMSDIFKVIYDCDNENFKADSILTDPPQNTVQISFQFIPDRSKKKFNVTLGEVSPQGPLTFHCDSCKDHCVHIGAALELLSVSLLKEETGTDYDEPLFDLQIKISNYQKQQRINIDFAKKPYPIPADLKFVGVSFKATNASLDSIYFTMNLPNSHWDKFDPEIYRTKNYTPAEWPKSFQHSKRSENRDIASYNSDSFAKQAQNISETLHFHFSDGRYIKSSELAYHPLADLLPEDLLLVKKDQANSKIDTNSFGGLVSTDGRYFWHTDLNETQRLIWGLLKRLTNSATADKFQIFLEQESSPGFFAEIKSFVHEPKKAVKWLARYHSSTEEFSLQPVGKAPFRIWQDAGNFLWDPETQTILFQKYKAILDLPFSLCQMYPPTRETLPHFDVNLIGTAAHELRVIGYEVEFESGTFEIAENEIETTIDFSRDGSFLITHSFETKTEKKHTPVLLSGFSKAFRNLLYISQFGIPGYKGYEAKELAVKTGLKRDMDMKLLKHMGVFQYLLIELLSIVLDGTLSNGEKASGPAKVWEHLEQKVALIFFDPVTTKQLDIPSVPLKTFFSERVLSYFKNFAEWFLESTSSRSYVYSEHGEIILKGIYKKELWILFMLLKLKMAETSTSQLFKSRTEILKNILVSPENGWLVPNLTDQGANWCRKFKVPGENTDSPNVLSSLMKIQSLSVHGFKFSMDGRRLEELGEADLRIQLLLENGNDENKKLSTSIDWFSLHPKVFLKGQEVDLKTHLPLLQKGLVEFEGKLYLVPQGQIPNLKRLESFWIKLQGGGSLSSFGKSQNIYTLPRSKVLDILALRASGVPVLGNSEWEEVCHFYDALGTSRKKIKLPKSLKAELKPYQEEGVQWLLDLHALKLGALLADDMGLGKTLQTLSFLEVLRTKKELGSVLIVVPPSLLYNWQSEIEKFVPDLEFTLLTGKNKIQTPEFINDSHQRVYVTTYGLLKEHEIIFAQKEWHIIIFDEAQNLKNISTQRTSAARRIKGQFKVCLTGTPMENHLGEFFSILDLAVSGCLDDLETFKKTYMTPSEINPEDLRYLKLKTKPLVLRRLKKDLLAQLPEKTETTIVVPFESKQRLIYRDVALAYNEKIQSEILEVGESKMQLQMLTALLRLRQICSDPSALPNITYKKTPPKLEALIDAAKEIVESGESILIFTQFLTTLNKAQQLLQKEGLQTFTLHGGLSATQKKNVISDFEKFQPGSVLILTLKTGGVGLNLTKASYVFHLEPWWNPAAENQATDRAHRMGQTKSVQVYRYIMHESVEEKIELLKKRKSAQFNSLFSDTEDGTLAQGQKSKTGSLTKEDFALLLS